MNMNNKEEDKLDDFDAFLSKIKEVGAILNDISSPDDEISKKGIERADKYLQKKEVTAIDEDGNFIAYSRSSLNRKSLEDSTETPNFSTMTAGEFMAAVEKDATERNKRKLAK